jgi:hypothetical protein
MTKQGGWTREWWPKDTQNYAKFQGWLPGSSPFRIDVSPGWQEGRLDHVNSGQKRSRESQKTTLGSQGTYLNRQSDSLKKSQLTLSQGMLKRWDDYDDVDDEVWTTVLSQNHAIATLSI